MNTTLNVAVVDNSKIDSTCLKEYTQKYCTERHLVHNISIFDSGEDFLKDFIAGNYDIIFLDIYMDGMNGMQVAQKIRDTDENVLLIFSTMSPDFAVTSYRVRAFDYLLKPFTYELFEKTIALCETHLTNQTHFIQVKEGRMMIKILLHDIIYTDYYNHYIQIHTKGRIVKTYMPFTEFSPMLLEYPQFMSCYRNCIVNMAEIVTLDERCFLLNNGESMPITKAAHREIQQIYADFVFHSLEGEQLN